MTNYDRWLLYMQDAPSPQSFIDFGFYFLISAALQRRVWFGDFDNPTFVNMYIVLVSDPGLGKGYVIGPINEMLRHHKAEHGVRIKANTELERPLLFKMAPDSITFESLLNELTLSVTRMQVPKSEFAPDGTIMHTSYCFVLEELAALFKRKYEDVIKFLHNAYDCKGYEYRPKHSDHAILRKLCVSLIAGTQPDFMIEMGREKLFSEGFGSRTIFIFESERRHNRFHIMKRNEEQKSAYRDLLDWVLKLSKLYGEITYTQETYEWLENWSQEILPKQELNCSTRMKDYYARKRINLMKLAAAIHFSENLSFEIAQSSFERALKLLDGIEIRMKNGLSMGRNVLHSFTTKVYGFIARNGKIAKKYLILQFAEDLAIAELESVLQELKLTRGVKETQNGNDIIYSV